MKKLVLLLLVPFFSQMSLADELNQKHYQPKLRLVSHEDSDIYEKLAGFVKSFKQSGELLMKAFDGGVFGSGGKVEEIIDYGGSLDLSQTPGEIPLRVGLTVVKVTEGSVVSYDIYVKEPQDFFPCFQLKGQKSLAELKTQFVCKGNWNIGIAKIVPTFELSFNEVGN